MLQGKKVTTGASNKIFIRILIFHMMLSFVSEVPAQRFNLPLTVFSYDTVVEQIAVIKQIMELYLVQEDEFHHASAMLELAIALHSLGDVELEEEK